MNTKFIIVILIKFDKNSTMFTVIQWTTGMQRVSAASFKAVQNFSIFYCLRATFLTQRRAVYEISVRRSIHRGLTDRRPHIWGNFKWPYLREGSSDPLHVWFYGGVIGNGGSNGAFSSLTKFNRYHGGNNARGVIKICLNLMYSVPD